MKNKNFIIKLIFFSLFVTCFNTYNLSQVMVKVPQLSTKITDAYLISQIDNQARKLDQLKLVTVGFAEQFKLLDANLSQFIDLFITTEEVNDIKDKLFSRAGSIVADYNNIYKKYIYPVAKEEEVSSGRSLDTLEESWIKLRKENFEVADDEIDKLISKSKIFIRDIKLQIDGLKKGFPGVLRYSESVNLVRSITSLVEKLINRVEKAKTRLKDNIEKRS